MVMTENTLDSEDLFDDQISCIVKQIAASDPVFTSHVYVKNISIKAKYEHLGIKKQSGIDSLKENSINKSHSEDQLDEARIILWHRSKVSLGWSNNYSHGAGMINFGNTCYLNSSLQALFHIPSLANWLLDETSTHIKGCENNLSCIGFCSICAMMKTIHTSLNKTANIIKPLLIHNRLKSIGKTLQYGRQEDAHEFIKLLLDHMQRSYILSCRAGKLDHRSRETTPLNQIFGGYLRQQVICPNCHHISTTFSHFQDIALDITTAGNVDEAIRQYFQKETLDAENAYKCEKCKRKVPATKRYHIEVVPNVLLLQLKRFSLSGGKINKSIVIREEINVTNYVWNNKNDGDQSRYKLVSMVNHLGSSQHSGHYTAVAKSANGTMHEFDDNSVRYISTDNALHRNPYLLFYELLSKPKHTKIRQIGDIQVQTKNGFLNQKSKQDLSLACDPGNSGHLLENTVKINGLNSSPLPVDKNRNKISFEIKLKSDNIKGLLNGSRTSNSILESDIRDLSNNNVQTWEGKASNTFESGKMNFSNKRSAHDLYNEEYDVGKLAKKKFKYEPIRRQDNPFQSYQNRNRKEGGNKYNTWHRHNKHGNQHRRNFKPHHGGNYNRNGYHGKSWHNRDNYRGGNEGYACYKMNRTA